MTNLKRNGVSHLLLLVLVVLVTAATVMPRGIGPRDAALFPGLTVYDFVDDLSGNNLGDEMFTELRLGMALVISLIIYYLVSAALVSLINLLWGEPPETNTQEPPKGTSPTQKS
jgi:hypothetical protein